MARYIDVDKLMADIEKTIAESGCVSHEEEILDCIRYVGIEDVVPAQKQDVVECEEKSKELGEASKYINADKLRDAVVKMIPRDKCGENTLEEMVATEAFVDVIRTIDKMTTAGIDFEERIHNGKYIDVVKLWSDILRAFPKDDFTEREEEIFDCIRCSETVDATLMQKPQSADNNSGLSKYINASELQNAIENMVPLVQWDESQEEKAASGEAFAAVNYAIDEAQAAEVEPKRKWIPCAKRLPEYLQTVLCLCENGGVTVSCITYEDEKPERTARFGRHYDVLAWMPLSELPEWKEEERENG